MKEIVRKVLNEKTSRRDFLKLLGLGGLALAAGRKAMKLPPQLKGSLEEQD